MMITRSILCALALWLLLAVRLVAEPVTIFAAASLKTVLDEVIAEQALDVRVSYGGSAAMARQVSQGAQADIVILAHPQWMTWLQEAGALDSAGSCLLSAGRLVLAAPVQTPPFTPNSAQDVIAALDGGRLALGNLRSVPAGQYAGAFLDAKGWLTALRPHMAETSNVRLALALVARGEAPLGFVYASDVAAEPKVHAVYDVPADLHPPIRYPAALTRDARAGAAAVLGAIAAAQDSFITAGFAPLPASETGRCRP